MNNFGVEALTISKGFNLKESNDEADSVVESDSESEMNYTKVKNCKSKPNLSKKTKTQVKSVRKKQIPSFKVRQNLACILNNTTAVPFWYRNSNFTCLFCKEIYPRCGLLQIHYEKEHSTLKLDPGDPILKRYKRGQTFLRLNIVHLTCKICLQTSSDYDSMIDHLISTHELEYDKSFSDVIETFKLCDDNYACHICGKEFAFFKILVRHIRDTHVVTEIVCDLCGKTFVRNAAYMMHKEYAHGPGFTCKECGKDFCSSFKLKSHVAKEHEGFKFKCPECPTEFPSPYQRKKHMITTHSTASASSFPCPNCEKLFICASHRHYHVRKVHLKERNAKCPICQEEVFDRHRLKLHMTKHLRERNHVCDICGKKYQWKKNFKQHMAKKHDIKSSRS